MQPKVKLICWRFWLAERRDATDKAIDIFFNVFIAYRLVMKKLENNQEKRLIFYDFQLAHWLSIKQRIRLIGFKNS